MDFFNLRVMTATFSFRKLEKLGAHMSHRPKAFTRPVVTVVG
jgi:hypothetical protein